MLIGLIGLLAGCGDDGGGGRAASDEGFGRMFYADQGETAATPEIEGREPVPADAPASLASQEQLGNRATGQAVDFFRAVDLELVHDGLAVDMREYRPVGPDQVYMDACLRPRPDGTLYLSARDSQTLIEGAARLKQMMRRGREMMRVSPGFTLDSMEGMAMSALERRPTLDVDQICARMIVRVGHEPPPRSREASSPARNAGTAQPSAAGS